MAEVAENTLVDGRYRMRNRIGSGGMADVWAAEDSHLGRVVALKVLHPRFADDEQFVERFRREASSAAALQHPNVVNVFDRGAHDGTYYIAMEHLRGRTLKQVIHDEGPLAPERAIDLIVQVLRAAGYAHRRGIVHRDFKPQNVIVSDDGIVKVTDFGIARAGASEMTETGLIMGTAHYLSPEQAQGIAARPASDLYSIGVMLFETLTGRVPFDGDSAVSIALKHVSEPPPRLRSLRPDLPPELEAVVARALDKDPDARYASAEEFARDLEHVRSSLGNSVADDTERTQVFAPFPPPPPPPRELVPAAAIAPAPPHLGDEDPPPERGRRARWPLLLAALALVALAVAAFAALRPGAEPVTVPRVVGQPLERAEARLARAGLDARIQRVASTEPVDRVVRQDPGAGRRVDEGSVVALAVSQGPPPVEIPDVGGLTQAQAERALSRARLEPVVQPRTSGEVEAGRVIRTVPRAGEERPRGSRVRVLVSTGPEQVSVPSVVGRDEGSARAELEGAGFAVTSSRAESEQPEGQVVGQTPGAGAAVDPGTTVSLTVSSGVQTEAVPSLTGLTRSQASAALREVGLVPVVRERSTDSRDEDGSVLSQVPAAGERQERGRNVIFYVGRYEAPPEEAPPSERENAGDEAQSPEGATGETP